MNCWPSIRRGPRSSIGSGASLRRKSIRPRPRESTSCLSCLVAPRMSDNALATSSMHPRALPDLDLLKQVSLTRGPSSGPGGQHRNRVQTLVTLHHEPTGIQAHAGERRSAEQNKSVALFRLRLALAIEVRRPVPIGDARSDLWKSRVSDGGRISCNPSHRDYPALLAEALDMIEACLLDTHKA